jgi:hypothetical protein
MEAVLAELGHGFFSGAFWSVVAKRFDLHKGILV